MQEVAEQVKRGLGEAREETMRLDEVAFEKGARTATALWPTPLWE
jgi:hypothetical protein